MLWGRIPPVAKYSGADRQEILREMDCGSNTEGTGNGTPVYQEARSLWDGQVVRARTKRSQALSVTDTPQ